VDQLDYLLLQQLRQNGRASHRALADAVGVSETAVRSRLDRLIRSGGVKAVGYVHPIAAGLIGTVHLSIKTFGPARPVATHLASLSQTQFVSLIAGDFAIIAEIRVSSYDTVGALIEVVKTIDGVQELSVLTQLKTLKDMHAPYGVPQDTSLDSTDWGILELLQTDGRMSYSELATRIGCSIGTARNRVIKLIDSGIVHIGAEFRTMDTLETHMAVGIGVIFKDQGTPVVDHMLNNPSIIYCATCVGRFDLVATLTGGNQAEILSKLERIRRIPQIDRIDAWTHLEVIKQSYVIERSAGGTEHVLTVARP
jgi:DNA-binding Lrp family transcriptional regulator